MCLREATSPQVGVKESNQPPKDFRNTVSRVSQSTLYRPTEKGMMPMLESVLKGRITV